MDIISKVTQGHRPSPVPFDVLTATASDLRVLLEEHKTTSVEIVKAYLGQISKHNKSGTHLNCVNIVVPEKILLDAASELDRERAKGHLRSPYHGIPFLVKDSIWTAASFSVPTTAGTYALKDAVARENADVVQALVDAGMIMLGKTNLSEMAGMKGIDKFAGRSVVGSQTQTPYVAGGVDPTDTWLGLSTPGGSSSGSAASVAAGMASVALGTETDGSILVPSDRASLYSLKLTLGKAPTRGTLGYTPFTDTLGPMTKSPEDVAVLLDFLTPIEGKSHRDFLTKSLTDIRIGFLDPAVWAPTADAVRPNADFTAQINEEVAAAVDAMEKAGAHVKRNVTLRRFSDEDNKMFGDIGSTDYANEFAKFARGLDHGSAKTMAELVAFNNEHASICLPPGTDQRFLEDALNIHLSDTKYEEYSRALRRNNKEPGIDKVLREYEVDVIMSIPMGRTATITAISGYPVGTVPLGYARFNGVAYGMCIIAPANAESLILTIMSAWESIVLPSRRPPPQLVDQNASEKL
ncbi:amidase signature domain-containing protein [Chaetomium sp. MPI-CAGE-AT-0009]|nr:amidase signature domain-containing protein [Chaetomium sp. MPI-CAGE-AT-0009]